MDHVFKAQSVEPVVCKKLGSMREGEITISRLESDMVMTGSQSHPLEFLFLVSRTENISAHFPKLSPHFQTSRIHNPQPHLSTTMPHLGSFDPLRAGPYKRVKRGI